MSDSLKVVLAPQQLERLGNGLIFGPLYLQIGGLHFPAEGWTDFPVVVLGWWLEAANAMSDDMSSREFAFMDGPYRFRFEGSGGARKMVCLKGGRDVANFANVNFRDFLKEIIACGHDCSAVLRNKGWSGPDVGVLEVALAEAEQRFSSAAS